VKSGNELLITNRIGLDEPENGVAEHEVIPSIVVQEGSVVELSQKMLGAQLVIRAN